MGYPVFYSDQEAKKILETDKAVRHDVTALLGDKAFANTIPNREYIGQKVFQDPEKLARLNSIIHPKVRQNFEDWKIKQNSKIVFNEAAILFETGAYKNFTKTVLVTAPKSLRINRVLSRNNTSLEEIETRMASQWDDSEKIKLADFVIENDDQRAVLLQLETMLKELMIG